MYSPISNVLEYMFCSFVGNVFTSTVLLGTQTVSLKEEEKKKKGQHTVYASQPCFFKHMIILLGCTLINPEIRSCVTFKVVLSSAEFKYFSFTTLLCWQQTIVSQ